MANPVLSLRVETQGLVGALSRIRSQMPGIAANATLAAALEFQNEWKSLFRSPTEESVPGLPPRVQTGTYRRDIHIEGPSSVGDRVTALVGTSLDYPLFLEYGTSRMPPHPIMRVAFHNARGRAAAVAMQVLRDGIGRAR